MNSKSDLKQLLMLITFNISSINSSYNRQNLNWNRHTIDKAIFGIKVTYEKKYKKSLSNSAIKT